MKKLALLLVALVPAAAVVIPARDAVATFPGPNGLIAYRADLAAGSTICAVHPDGGTPFRLTEPEQEARDPAWSPSGDELLLTSASIGDPLIMRMPAYGLGAGATPVTSGQMPAWSPDGNRIAFVRDSAIYTADIDGTNGDLLVDRGSNPAWSPDGTQIAFDDEMRDGSVDNGGIYLVPSTGGEVRYLSSGFEPSWSPDGTEIAARNHFFADAIVAINVGTGQSREITPDTGFAILYSYPAWSPNGELIAAVTKTDPGSPETDIALFRADGSGEAARFPGAPHARDLDWQPVVQPATPSTGQAVDCVSYPYERSVSLRLSGHLLAEGRVRSLDARRSCHRFVPVQIRKKTANGERVFYVRSRRSGRFKLRLPDKTGRYYATIAPDDRVECAGDDSPIKSHRH